MRIGAGAPHNFWEIGAKATCTNPEKGATVRTAKNQGWFWIILKISLSGGKTAGSTLSGRQRTAAYR